jgi:glycosyltransferase involved in cell wall biosynthesis
VTLVVITWIPSPSQVELFDALAEQERGLRVVYVARREKNRRWANPELRHEAMFLDDAGPAHGEFFRWVEGAELTVFSYYSCKPVREAMRRCEALHKPWCFWGERLGYHHLGWLGTASRHIFLRTLHRSSAPIWTMGSWAVQSYQREFGTVRRFFNVPYCSNLQRFRAAGEHRTSADRFRFLYSGSLIHRKGVDLLARAFKRLATQLPFVSLAVTGHGPLRGEMQSILSSVSNRVTFLPDVDWHRLPAYYADADVLCAPSRYDGWGMVVPEGLASGLPVISTNRMGAGIDLIRPGCNGWLVPADNEEALYQAMLQAVTMGPAKWRSMSECATKSCETHDLRAGTERFLDAARLSVSEWPKAKIGD